MFSLVQHLLYRVDPMADSYEMNHMVVNTTAETVGTKKQAELWNGLHREVFPKDCRQVWSGPNSREPPVTDIYGVCRTTGNFAVNPIVVSHGVDPRLLCCA